MAIERIERRTMRQWIASIAPPSCPVHGLGMRPDEGEVWVSDVPERVQGYGVTFWCPFGVDTPEECWEEHRFELATHRWRD